MNMNMNHLSSLRKKEIRWFRSKALDESFKNKEVHHAVFCREIIVLLVSEVVQGENRTMTMYKVGDVSDHLEWFDRELRSIYEAKNYVERVLRKNIP